MFEDWEKLEFFFLEDGFRGGLVKKNSIFWNDFF